MKTIVTRAFAEFNRRLFSKLTNQETIIIHQIGSMLSMIRGEVLQTINPIESDKKEIRRILNLWSDYIQKTAEGLRNSPSVHTEMLIDELFLGNKLTKHGENYLIFTDEEGNCHFHTIIDYMDDGILGAIGKTILNVDTEERVSDGVFYDLSSNVLNAVDAQSLFRKAARNSIASISQEEPIIKDKTGSVPLDNNSAESKTTHGPYIGKILTRDKRTAVINAQGQFLQGFFYSSAKNLKSIHGSYFISEKENVKLLLTLEKMEFAQRSISGQEQTISEMTTPALFRVLRQVEFDHNGKIQYDGSLTRDDYSDFEIRQPTKDDYPFLNLSMEGTHIGFLEIDTENRLPFYLPPNKEFESIFVSGVMGAGKTNLLVYLAATLNSRMDPPSIVIFDVEGDYTRLGDSLPEEIDDELLKMGLTLGFPFRLERRKLSLDNGGDSTLCSAEIPSMDIPALVPELPSVSEDMFFSITRSAQERLKLQGQYNIKNLLEEVKKRAYSQITNIHARSAIIRACESDVFEIFDQTGMNPIMVTDLCVPGKIIIIDISELHTLQRRTAILSILTMLNSYKDRMENRQKPVIVFVDEAHQLFPSVKSGQLKKNQIDRIRNKLDYISHQGRKRKYGLVLATQSLNDINPEVASLCNTQIIMSNSGMTPSWLKDRLNGISPKEINNLQVGMAYIAYQGSRTTYRIRIPKVVK